jgi:uncharacterized membrane protein
MNGIKKSLQRIRNNKRLSRLDKTSSLFVLIAAFFGLFFVFAVPFLWGADETTHVGRVYQIAHGHAFSHVVHEGYSHYGFGGEVPNNLKKIINYVNYDFNVNSHQTIGNVKWVDNPSDYKAFADLPWAGKSVEYNFSNTAIYSPISYVPSVVGFWVAELLGLHIGATIFLARIFDLAFFIAGVAFVLWSLRAFRAKWIIFTVALLPMTLFQASMISADAVTNTLALAIVGLVIKALLSKALTKPELWVLLTATLLLPVAKPSYLFIALLTLLVPARLVPVRQYKKYFVPAAVVAGILLYLVWQYKTAYLSNASKDIIAGVVPWWQQIDSAGQAKYVLHHPFSVIVTFVRTIFLADNAYFDGLFGKLGFDYVQVPAIAIIASFVSLVLAASGAEVFTRTKQRTLLIAGVLLASIAAIFGTLYLTISYVGQPTIEGVQGRYFLPVLPVFLFFIAYMSRSRLALVKRQLYKNYSVTLASLVLFSLFVSAIKYFYITWG